MWVLSLNIEDFEWKKSREEFYLSTTSKRLALIITTLTVFEWIWKRTAEKICCSRKEERKKKSMSNRGGSACNPPHSLICCEPPRAPRGGNATEPPVRTSLYVPSLGMKYCTQSKMKLALSGLLNRSQGAVSLFCSHTCDSNHCHTSNYKLIA